NMTNVEHIEIIDGAMSAQYGSNASGGVINIITRKSQIEKFKFQSQNQIESIGITNNAATFSTRLGKFYASLGIYRNHFQFAPVDSLRLIEEVILDDGSTVEVKKTPWNPKLQKGIESTLRYKFSDSIDVHYQFRIFDEDLTLYDKVNRPVFKPYSFDEAYNTSRQDHNLQFKAYLSDKFYLNTNTGYNQFVRTKTTERIDFENDSTSLVPGGQDTTTFSSVLQRTSLSSIFSGAWNGQIGFEYLHEQGSGKRIVDSTSNPINSTYIDNIAGWLSLRYQQPRLTLQGNLRMGYNSIYNYPLIPSFHVQWTPLEKLKIQASYANGFRSPSLKELYFNFIDINHFIIGNNGLIPENSKNATIDITFNNSSKTNSLELGAKLFYNYITDKIILAEFESAKYQYQNLDRYETHGFNLTANWTYQDWLRIKSGFGYTNLYNFWSEEYNTPRFTAMPEMQNQISLSWNKLDMQLILSHRFWGKQIRFYQDADNNIEQGFIGSYNLVNATLSKFFWEKRIFLAVGSKNLFDVQTIPFVGVPDSAHGSNTGSQLLSWGRTFFVKLDFNF
ncbi:MAG: TonB-dependent receptor, partial [Saprospiraceae bacterium]|nr:TonB-dependent receptor [Saprospiraceae bacterium]